MRPAPLLVVTAVLACLSEGVRAGAQELRPQPPIDRVEEPAREAAAFVALGRAWLSEDRGAGRAILAFEEALRISPRDAAASEGLARAWDVLVRDLREHGRPSPADEAMLRIGRLRAAFDGLGGSGGTQPSKAQLTARSARESALQTALDLAEGVVFPSGPLALTYYERVLEATRTGERPTGDTLFKDIEADRSRAIREGITSLRPELTVEEAHRRAAQARRWASKCRVPQEK